MKCSENVNFKKHGKPPYNVVVIHGGPGGPGTMKDLATELSKNVGVLEPYQTKLNVNDQINELAEIIENNTEGKVILIGHSWGAILSYLFAAKNLKKVKKLIMVGSAVFENKYAEKILETRLKRLSEQDKKFVQQSFESKKTKLNSDTLKQIGDIFLKTDNIDPTINQLNIYNLENQAEIHEKVWADFLKIRANGDLLLYADKIKCPVVVIHGDYDPHPFLGIKEPLEDKIKDIKSYLLPECGHWPWLERGCASKFYSVLLEEMLL